MLWTLLAVASAARPVVHVEPWTLHPVGMASEQGTGAFPDRTKLVTVTQTVLPADPHSDRLPTGAVTPVVRCLVSLEQADLVWEPTVRGCPPSYLAAVEAVLPHWQLSGAQGEVPLRVDLSVVFRRVGNQSVQQVGIARGFHTPDVESNDWLAVVSPSVFPTKVVAPSYPRAARRLDHGEQQCVAHILVDDQGRPTRVDVEGCPEVYHPNVEQAVQQWRYAPYNVDEKAVPVYLTQPIRFKLH